MASRKEIKEYYELYDYYMKEIETQIKTIVDEKIKNEYIRIEEYHTPIQNKQLRELELNVDNLTEEELKKKIDEKKKLQNKQSLRIKTASAKSVRAKYNSKQKLQSIVFRFIREYIQELILSKDKDKQEFGNLLKLQQEFIRREEYDELRKAIKRKFGGKSIEASDFTLEEIGGLLGVTRERVRQIEASAEKKLKHPLNGRKLKAYTQE